MFAQSKSESTRSRVMSRLGGLSEVAVRGTRPKNRRELILTAAADLFYDHGYEKVSMAMLADTVGIGRSALYRHFSNKQSLLAAVILERVQPLVDRIQTVEPDDFNTLTSELGQYSLDHRRDGVLWHREARFLDADALRTFQLRVDSIIAVIDRCVASVRQDLTPRSTELLAWAILAVYLSPSFHRIDLPATDFLAVLSQITSRIVSFPEYDFADPVPEFSIDLQPLSRKEALIAAATRLFAERGYDGVSTDDIGRAIGMAGPSVYNHVTSKGELLQTAIRRGGAYLMIGFADALSASATSAQALDRLGNFYVQFASNHHHLLTLLISDIRQLEPDTYEEAVGAQRDYLAEWTHLLVQAEPHLQWREAQIRIQAAVTIVNTTARINHLRRSPGYPVTLASLIKHSLK
jgi:AcrR family transcriptional regulator